MHPVNYLLEDIYRNDWSIGSATNGSMRRGKTGLRIRGLSILVERKRI